MLAFEAVDRRVLLRNVALLLGASSTISLSACKAALTRDGALGSAQMAQLVAIADTLIPAGTPAADRPGAVAAQVPQLLAGLMRDWASADTRTALGAAIDAVGALGEKGDFARLDAGRRLAVLGAFDAAAIAAKATPVDRGYIRLKQLIIDLFQSSEAAMTKLYYYEPVPGRFVASIPVAHDA